MTRQYKPIRDKLIVKVFTGEKKTASGLIIELAQQEESLAREEGIVLAIGKSCFYDTQSEDLEVGDRIAFAKYAGKILENDRKDYQIRTMRDIDVLCVIEEIDETITTKEEVL